MSTFIFTDNTTDLHCQDKYNDFEILNITFTIDDETHEGTSEEFTVQEFYARMRKGSKVSTSMINQQQFLDAFEPVLKEGKDILYLCFSSALSGTYNQACLAARELQEKYPNNKIEIFDSLNASLGEGLFVHYVLEKREKGASLEELVEYAKSIVDNVCSYFTVDDLKHLARMGRVSKTAAFIGELIQIKPVLYVNKLGELIPISKVKTRKKALKALVDKMEDKMLSAGDQSVVYIGHGDCEEDAQFVADEIRERFGIKNIMIDYIGPVIGSHTNAGVVALFFLGENKIEEKDARVNA